MGLWDYFFKGNSIVKAKGGEHTYGIPTALGARGVLPRTWQILCPIVPLSFFDHSALVFMVFSSEDHPIPIVPIVP